MTAGSEPSRVMANELRRRIGADEFSFEFTTSRGPGGQNVNKVATRAVLSFPLYASVSLSAAEQDRVWTKLRRRINAEGVLRVASSRFRTQQANRIAAQERF